MMNQNGSTLFTNNSTISRLGPEVTLQDQPPPYSTEFLYVVLIITLVEPHRNLKEYSQTPCTGTMIRNDLVLTAASCLKMNTLDELDPTSTEVVMRDGTRLRSLKIFVHYDYSKSHIYNFAVIVVEKSNVNVFPKLPKEDVDIDFESILNSCILGGYGDQHRSISPSKFSYKMLNMTTVDIIKCRERQGVEKMNRLCLHFHNLQPCRGDVGSPLICNGKVLALFTPMLVGSPKTCVDRYGTVFTPVTVIVDWVNKIVSSPSANLEWMNNPWYILLLCSSALGVIGGIYYLLMELMQRNYPLDFEEEMENTDDNISRLNYLNEDSKEPKDDEQKWRRIQNLLT
ncbi:snake venom serine protease homolog [Homalodisca vitripennis]|nr:snake venom serine protease homolog [Homalodisca vitripennis]